MRDATLVREAAAAGDYARAASLARALARQWPGYSDAMVAWCMYWQLNPLPPIPNESLDAVRDVLRAVSELESAGLDGTYELGRFLFAVDDNPEAARDLAIAEISRSAGRLRRFESLLREAEEDLGAGQTFQSSVFVVQHVHELGSGHDDVKFIGVYSSRVSAEQAIERTKVISGFRDAPGSFVIDEYVLDRDHWGDGFVTT